MAKERIVNGELVTEEAALDNYEDGESLTLQFIPIKEMSYKPTNGFGTYICELANLGENPPVFNAKGTFVRPLDLGQTYEASGSINIWRGQKQYKIEEIKKIIPSGKRGIISFLRSLDGMKYQAEVIYDTYGEDSLNVIKDRPMELLNLVNSAYPELVQDWQRQILNIKDDYSMLTELMKLGIRSEHGKMLYDKYGALIFEMLQNNPYILSKEVPGYGFKRCDMVAKNLGIPANSQARLCEGIAYILRGVGDEGHTYIRKDELTKRCIEELSIKMTVPEMKRALKSIKKDGTYDFSYGSRTYTVDGYELNNALRSYSAARTKRQKELCRLVIDEVSEEDIEMAYKTLVLEERIIIDGENVFDKQIYVYESGIAAFIKEIQKHSEPIDVSIDSMIQKYCTDHGVELEAKQKQAIENSAGELGNVSIISGAAGCGKTFCIKAILEILEKVYSRKKGYFSKIIIAPTGKASQVAEKATGIESSTVHRALVCKPGGGFFYNSGNKLPYDCIVIDESSMLDCSIAYHLFSAIAPATKVIMVGDPNQLPSIGAGNILKDMINSGVVTTTTLDVIKRQGADSGIVLNSHRIIRGEMISSNRETMDFAIYKASTDTEYLQKLLKYADQLYDEFGINGMQVLSPQRTGPLGTNYLNFIFQERFNQIKSNEKILKQKFEVSIDGETEEHELFLKRGDKVINTRNNYTALSYQIDGNFFVVDDNKTGVVNGEMGTIVQITQQTNQYNEWENTIVVKFDDRYVVYNNDFDDLELCYAMTIHKSQGSEWPGVIMPIHPSQKYMLDKNILYTGLTRAKKKGIIISDKNTLMAAIANDKSSNRNTALIQYVNTTPAY